MVTIIIYRIMKMTNSLIFSTCAFLIFMFAACERDSGLNISEDDQDEVLDDVENVADHDESSDYSWDSSDVVPIVLNGNSITVAGNGATADGSKVTITSAGTYSVSGELTDGQIIVDTEDEAIVRVILSGADISCSSNAPIYVENAEITMIVLDADTKNTVTDGTTYSADEEDANAAIFSKGDLTIYGEGSLTVNGNYNDGITSKDGLIIASGTITVNSEDDGIRGKDYLIVKDGNITVDSEGDGLKSDNDEDSSKGYISIDAGTFNITSGGDAITAETDVIITTGEITLTSGGGSNGNLSADTSAKGIKSGVGTIINGGTISIDAADDALHSNGDLEIYDGAFYIASGDDGIHADADVLVNDGIIDITKSYEGIESFEGNITVNAGEIYLTTSDDGFNIAAGGVSTGGGPGRKSVSATSEYSLNINGGYIVVDATGDGLDSNGSIEFIDGTAIVNGPTLDNNGAIDCDGSFNMNGGLLIAAGSSGMAESPSTSSGQYSVLVKFSSKQQAGNLIHIQTNSGEEILSFAPEKSYQSIVYSSPLLQSGSTYDVYLGGSTTGTDKDGLFTDGTYTPGSKYSGFTISGIVTSIW